jgi:hypothetical protein
VATRPATKNTGASGVAIGFAGRSAVGTGEAVAPSRALKVCRTCCLVRKQALELRKRTRERQIVSLKHVDDHDFFTLAQVLNILLVVGVCDNRISTVKRNRRTRDRGRRCVSLERNGMVSAQFGNKVLITQLFYLDIIDAPCR